MALGGRFLISFVIKSNILMRKQLLIITAISIGLLTLSSFVGSDLLLVLAGCSLIVSALGLFFYDKKISNANLINQLRILSFTLEVIILVLIIEHYLNAPTSVMLFTALPIALIGSFFMALLAWKSFKK